MILYGSTTTAGRASTYVQSHTLRPPNSQATLDDAGASIARLAPSAYYSLSALELPTGVPNVIQIAIIFLFICLLLCIAATISFSWSFAAARLLLLFANVAAAVGALEIAMTIQLDGLATWAILFASGAFSCGAIALRNVKDRPIRWVHRFVIYAGYAATLAAMAIAAVLLNARDSSGMFAGAALIGIYVAGSGCIFLAKTLIVRTMAKRMPEYAASLTAGPRQYT
jgi:hypothetical protein